MANDAQVNASATNLQLLYSCVLCTNVQTLNPTNQVSTRILIHVLVLTLYFWIWSKIGLWVVVLNYWTPFMVWPKPYLELLCWTMIWPKSYLELLCWTKGRLSWSDQSLTLSCCVESIDICHDLTYVLPGFVVFNQWTSVMIWQKSYLELLCWIYRCLSWSDICPTSICCV